MPVTFQSEQRTMTAYISGEIDHHNAREIMTALDREVDGELPLRLVLNLSGVTFMDSSGIAVLLRAWRRMEELEGTLRVEHIPDQSRRVLDAAGVGRIITLS